MTRAENDYIKQLVEQANRHIKEVYSGTLYDFMGHDQREGYIQGVSSALEPFAALIGMKVAGVDLNSMK